MKVMQQIPGLGTLAKSAAATFAEMAAMASPHQFAMATSAGTTSITFI